MQSKFDFLAEQFPRLAEYGRKAERALGIDNNICLLNLGRIAETITEILSTRNSIKTVDPDVLLQNGIIDESICLKIKTLTEIKDEAANNDYDSESSASRMIAAALELCEWFVSQEENSRFAFLGDMFPENEPYPPLACLAEYGTDAEANLHSNTRYCLLCLGDIEEAVTDIFLERSGISIPDNMEQHKKINKLLKPLGTANSDKICVLHDLRQARNDAVHGRYDSKEAAKKLTEKALELCEWVFMFLVSPGDFVRGRITCISEDEFSVSVGRIRGTVKLEDIPPERRWMYREGERRVLRVTAKGSDGLRLSLEQATTDPWTNMRRRYERYEVGQVLSVMVKRISENEGAVVKVSDSGDVEARIPKSEFGAMATPVRSRDVMRLGDTLKTKVLEIDPEHYPYMLLSIEEMEREQEASTPDKWASLNEHKSEMSDKEFITFCCQATHEEMIAALDAGANPNARSNFGTTPLMEAAHMNDDLGAIKELIDAGAKVNAKNDKGNTALIFAAMHNVPEVVRLLCENGADIEPMNNQGRDALSYAMANQKLKNDDGIIQLLTSEDAQTGARIAPPKAKGMNDRQFIGICKKGKEEAIMRAIEGGANVNAKDSHGTTALIYASMFDIPSVVAEMLERGANVNAANKKGITPLLNAVMNNRYRNIEILLEHGAEVRVSKKRGRTLLEYAREKLSNKKGEVCLRKIEFALGLPATQDENALDDERTVSQDVIAPADEELPATQGGTAPTDGELSATNAESAPDNDELPATNDETAPDELPVTQTVDAPIDEPPTAQDGKAPVDDELSATNDETAPDELPVTQTVDAPIDELPTPQDVSAPVDDSDSTHTENTSPDTQTSLSDDQQEEAHRALKLTFQRDILKIARSGSIDDLTQAISSGVSINVKNKSLATPLMFAAKSNSVDVIDLLVHSGADLDAQDSNGNTPLIYAAAYNTDDVVDSLLDAGADTSLKNLDGYSALDYAKTNYRLIDSNALLRLQE